ncbi:MAG: tRNA threonylcarbamoyladenosine dehydratase [Firmicutes bacterium]|nr:tRNA threonylcarbamoyladenosine dehydratase [Bacillota bacterium]
MMEEFSRTEMLIGAGALERLAAARVAVFGVGGVGGYVVEALARGGVGALDLIDDDTVKLSNINRQIIALHSTIGQYKVDVAAERVADISPSCKVTTYRKFFLPENAGDFVFSRYDYVVDAIDTVSGKIALVEACERAGVPVISAMGAGNKLDPAAFEVADISKTSVCPLARVMRRELGLRGIKHLKVVYSKEPPIRLSQEAGSFEEAPRAEDDPAARHEKKRPPGSCSFVPPVCGLIIAGEVIKDLTRSAREGR